MPEAPTLPALSTTARAAKCPKCGGLLLQHTEYDPEMGEERLLKCANCGFERPLTPITIGDPPTADSQPIPEPQPPAKRHFQRRTERGAWPPEAHRFVAEIVNSQTGRKPKQIAAAVAAGSNLPEPTVLAWIKSSRLHFPDTTTAPVQQPPDQPEPDPADTAPNPPDYPNCSRQDFQAESLPGSDPQLVATPPTPAELARQLLAAATGRVLTRLEITPQSVILETEPPPTLN